MSLRAVGGPFAGTGAAAWPPVRVAAMITTPQKAQAKLASLLPDKSSAKYALDLAKTGMDHSPKFIPYCASLPKLVGVGNKPIR